MKKINFVGLVMGVMGTLMFGVGMCMALLPEWDMMKPGIACGGAGLVVLLADVIIWRRASGKAPIRISAKVIGSIALATAGALLLGAGMSLCMVYDRMAWGIPMGMAGILVLLMLIPVTKGLQN